MDRAGGLNITIDAAAPNTVGTHQTVLIQCTAENKLNELYLDLFILQNTANIQVKTVFTVTAGETFNYTFPNATENDPLQLVLQSLAGVAFPPFLSFDNDTSTLVFFPDVNKIGSTFSFNTIFLKKDTLNVLQKFKM